MNKYKTIDPQRNSDSLVDGLANRRISNRQPKNSGQSDTLEKALMSTNKNVIFIKLPKRKNQINNSCFRASLYESSIRRLKQQNATIVKDLKIPTIKSNRGYEQYQEEIVRKAMKDNILKKKQYFPNLNLIYEKKERMRSRSHLAKLEEKSAEEEQEQQTSPNSIAIQFINPELKSVYEIDGSGIVGFRNLKQKYLQHRYMSLSKQKNQLYQSNQNRRSYYEQESNEVENKFKMQRQIMDHMTRHMKKDFFQTKINGFKTALYPNEGNLAKHKHPKYKKKEVNCVREDEQNSNFIKRKKARNMIQHVELELPQAQLSLRQQKKREEELSIRPNINSERYQELDQCTPWQTDIPHFY